MLLSLDLAGGRIQEQGRVFVEPDGTVERDGADRILTTLMRHTATGWVPSFPGSDRSVMTRRKPG